MKMDARRLHVRVTGKVMPPKILDDRVPIGLFNGNVSGILSGRLLGQARDSNGYNTICNRIDRLSEDRIALKSFSWA
jgi:hypothetical protein